MSRQRPASRRPRPRNAARARQDRKREAGGAAASFRPGLARIPWRVARVFLVGTALMFLCGLAFWNGSTLITVSGFFGSVMLVGVLAMLLYTMLRVSNTWAAIGCAIAAAVAVIAGGACFNDWYLTLRGERVDGVVSLRCESVVRKRRPTVVCEHPLHHPDGRRITGDFENAGLRVPDRPRPGVVRKGTLPVYWDPAGLVAPARAPAVEDPAKHWKLALSLGLLAASPALASLYGERRGGRRPHRP